MLPQAPSSPSDPAQLNMSQLTFPGHPPATLCRHLRPTRRPRWEGGRCRWQPELAPRQALLFPAVDKALPGTKCCAIFSCKLIKLARFKYPKRCSAMFCSIRSSDAPLCRALGWQRGFKDERALWFPVILFIHCVQNGFAKFLQTINVHQTCWQPSPGCSELHGSVQALPAPGCFQRGDLTPT